MSKKFSHKSDDYDDGYENYSYRDDLKDRRKEKRIKNALRTNNIDYLIDLDEDY